MVCVRVGDGAGKAEAHLENSGDFSKTLVSLGLFTIGVEMFHVLVNERKRSRVSH